MPQAQLPLPPSLCDANGPRPRPSAHKGRCKPGAHSVLWELQTGLGSGPAAPTPRPGASPDTAITRYGQPVIPPCHRAPLVLDAREAALRTTPSGHQRGNPAHRRENPPRSGHRGQTGQRLGHSRVGRERSQKRQKGCSRDHIPAESGSDLGWAHRAGQGFALRVSGAPFRHRGPAHSRTVGCEDPPEKRNALGGQPGRESSQQPLPDEAAEICLPKRN